MKNRMEELLSCSAEQNRPELIVSVSELRLTIQEGKKYKGSIRLEAEDGSRIRGLVTSDSHRILLADNSIAGETCTVLFGVDTTGLGEGDRISGNIVISCNLAEMEIPVLAEIRGETIRGSEGEIRSLGDFSGLCRKSFREGFRLFAGDSFSRFLERGEADTLPLLPLYQGLSAKPVTYQHLEEFLIAAGEKDPVRISLDGQEKGIYHLERSQKDTLNIYKNNWGYVRIEVEVTGAFLQVEKRVLTSEDFVGKTCGLEYIVDAGRLHPGRNYGMIRLKTVRQELEFRIEASAGNPVVESLTEGRCMAALTRDMLELQTRRIDYRTWYDRGQKILSDLKEYDPESSPAVLYDAYLSYTGDDLQRMRMLLSLFRRGSRTLKSREEKIWYIYLCRLAGIRTEDTEQFLSILRQSLEQAPDQYLYLHLLLQEDPSYEHMSARVMFELEQCYEKGGNSPFLYLKAWKMLNEQESLLRRITPFYLQVLRFAAVRNLLSESLYRRCAFLSGSLREFSEPVYRLLASGYRKYQCVDILEAVCRQIMKGHGYRKEYFVWYSLAVEKELRITHLYEYYMETLPDDMADQIPRQIRMYFAYNNTLGEKKRALLYSSVLRNRDRDRSCYAKYRSVIREFAVQSLEKGRISPVYAELYRGVLKRPDTRELAEKLAEILFCHRLEVKDPSIRNVVVCHQGLKGERIYPCRSGTAYIDLYSKDACILFEDEKKRRFCSGVEYSCSPLMEVQGTAEACRDMGAVDTGLALYFCSGRNTEVTDRNLACFRYAESDEAFSSRYRETIRQKLLDYCRRNLRDDRLLISVLSGDMRDYGTADRVSTAVLLIESGLYEKACDLVSEFGFEGIPGALLLRLTSRMILKKEYGEDEELLCLAEYVFRQGKYDETILAYLVEYSMGSIPYLCRLWKRVRGFGMESLKLEKRILTLAVLTGRMPEEAGVILESYVLNQGQESVITEFLTWVCGRWFYREIPMPLPVSLYLEKLAGRGWELNLLCRLALLKYYAGLEELDQEQEEEARRILSVCEEEELAFAFFTELPHHLVRSCHPEDTLFVEERFPPGTEVTIHYRLGRGDREGDWKSEPLREMVPGIFSREFLLFHGEVLTFRLSWKRDGEEMRQEERRLILTDPGTEGSSRCRLLNRILAAKAMGNQEKMQSGVEEYLWKEAFTEHFCKIM